MSVQRVKYLYRVIDQRAGIDQPPLLAVSIHHGVVRRDTLTEDLPRAEDLSNYKLCEPGDIALNRMRAFQGAIGICPQRGLVSPDYAVLRPGPDVDARYLHHLFRSSSFVGEMVSRLRGIGNTENGAVRTPRINPEDLGDIPVDFPPLDDQRRIADFLDAETARIDRLAALRTSQTEALKAHYQSQLSEMAQGLCGRYGVVKVRHVLQKIEQGWSPQCEDRAIGDGEWGVVKAGCVNGGIFDVAEHKALPTGTEPELRYRLRAGNLLMSRASGSVDLIGSIAVLPDDLPSQLLLCDKVYRLRMDRTRMTPYFVAYMLRTLEVREQIKLGISGAEGMANNLPTATVTNLPLPDVPLLEQGSVVSDLNDSWQAVHNTTQTLKQQLAVLSERRQALITAAVTGGIAV